MLAAAALLIPAPAPEFQDPDILPILRVGEMAQGEITDGDEVVHTPILDASYPRKPAVSRSFAIQVADSGPYHVDLRSYYFDAYLVLRDEAGELLAEDDDGWIGLHSRVVAELEAGGRYLVQACALSGGRGPFELTLTPERPEQLSLNERARLERADAERRLAVVEAYRGPEHPDTAACLSNLAVLLWQQGSYAAARPINQRALAIHEKTLGPEHPSTATSLANLAVLIHAQGEYNAARPLYERALAIREKVLGPEHPDTANTLSTLASLLHDQGDYEAARPLYERALAIHERVLGPDHPHTAASLNGLALLLKARGDREAARPLLKRVLAIHERALGPDHPHVATSLGNLATLLDDLGEFDAARPLFERALGIYERALGPGHPHTATGLGNLAGLLKAEGDYAAAKSLFERALAIHETALGPEHPDTTRSLVHLARVQADLDEPRQAWETVRKGRERRDARRARLVASLTEAERYVYLAQLLEHLALELSLSELLDEAAARVAAYESLLAWKGLVARTLHASRAQLAAAMTPEQRGLMEELRASQARLSALALEADARDPESSEARLRRAREERNRIELDLHQSLGGSSTASGSVTFPELRAALPERSAVLDFFVNHGYEPARWQDAELVQGGRWSEKQLSVWITSRRSTEPVRLDLGSTASIQAAVRSHLERIRDRPSGIPSFPTSRALSSCSCRPTRSWRRSPSRHSRSKTGASRSSTMRSSISRTSPSWLR